MLKLAFCLLLAGYGATGSHKSEGTSYRYVHDSLYSKMEGCIDTINRHFFRVKNIHISTAYMIKDAVKMDVNGDGVQDIFLVLSPYAQEYQYGEPACVFKAVDKRLLVLLVSEGKRYKMSFINEHAIPDVFECQDDAFEEIGKTKDSSVYLDFFCGTIVKCRFTYYFKTDSGVFYLTKTVNECFPRDGGDTKNTVKRHKKSANILMSNFDGAKAMDFPSLEALKPKRRKR